MDLKTTKSRKQNVDLISNKHLKENGTLEVILHTLMYVLWKAMKIYFRKNIVGQDKKVKCQSKIKEVFLMV